MPRVEHVGIDHNASFEGKTVHVAIFEGGSVSTSTDRCVSRSARSPQLSWTPRGKRPTIFLALHRPVVHETHDAEYLAGEGK